MATLSERLNYLFNTTGKTQVEVGDACGISTSMMSLYLSGKRGAKQDKIYLLSKYFDVDPVWLMGFDVPMRPSVSTSVSQTVLDEEEMLSQYRQLPDKFKEIIKSQISMFLSIKED